jgi:hypothetical protein
MLPTIPETMRDKLRRFRQLDPDSYREMCRRILSLDALPSDALSDQQLETISDIMLGALTRQAHKRALAKPH